MRFRFLLFTLTLLALAFSPPVFGQSRGVVATLNAANQCAQISVTGQATVGIQVTGTFSATLQPEVSIQGQAAQNTQVTPSTSSTAQSTITGTGAFATGVAGYDTFLVCVSSYASGSAVVYLNASSVVNAKLFGGSSGLPAGLSFASPTLTISSATNGNGVLALSGNTSGAATFTAPAVAGTPTNPIIVSNALVDTSGYLLAAGSVQGMAASGASTIIRAAAGGTDFLQDVSGNTFLACTVASCKGPAYISAGTTFTSSGGLGDTTLVGGATAGKFATVTVTSGSTVITMGNAATAPNGWHCSASDVTHPADIIVGTSTSATQATLTVATAITAADVIEFSCIGF